MKEYYFKFIAWVFQVDKALRWVSRNHEQVNGSLSKAPRMIRFRIKANYFLTNSPWSQIRRKYVARKCRRIDFD